MKIDCLIKRVTDNIERYCTVYVKRYLTSVSEVLSLKSLQARACTYRWILQICEWH